MFGREVHFQAMSHIEHLVHFAPVRIALLLDGLEQRRNGEKVVFDYAAVVTYEVQHLGLCAARAVYHTVDFGAECIQKLLYYRCVGAGGGKYQLSCIQRTVFDTVCQFQLATVYQLFGYSLVIAFRVFLCQVFGEYIVACAGQSVTAHTAIVFFLISSLSVRCQTYNHIARTDIGIVYNI